LPSTISEIVPGLPSTILKQNTIGVIVLDIKKPRSSQGRFILAKMEKNSRFGDRKMRGNAAFVGLFNIVK
jgi:hypothetical protein